MVQTIQIVRERLGRISDNFGTPSENVGEIEKSKDPQERSGALKRLSISDTSEKKAQENIQGVGIQLAKQNKYNGSMPAVPEGGCKHARGEDASTTNLKKGFTEKCKTNMQTFRGSVDL